MSRHDMEMVKPTVELWWVQLHLAFGNRNPGRGAHRAAQEPSAWTGEVVDVFGLRMNETTGWFHPSRLVGK